uniref:Putative secreted protein n=1 Tax=Anopheles darlingi TaxID=43151 RepID=A0A2M4DCE3_ANODA
MVRFAELILLFRAPWISARAPAEDVQYDDTLDWWQLHDLTVYLQPQLLVQLLHHLTANHLAQAHLHVHTLVVQPRVELVRVFLARIVEIQAQIGIDADAKVVVHYEDLRVVLALCPSNYG